MKHPNTSYTTLLESLSVQGDSTAFFSLCEPYFRARYQQERNNGNSHTDTSTSILAEATELFETFQSLPAKEHATWLEEHCPVEINSAHDTDEVFFDNKITAETTTFLQYCSYELMKTASTFRQRKSDKAKTLGHFIFHSRITYPVGIPVLCLLIAVSIMFTMKQLGTSLTITLTNRDRHVSITLPPPPLSSDDNTPQHLSLIKEQTEQEPVVDTSSQPVDSQPVAQKAKSAPPSPVIRRRPVQPTIVQNIQREQKRPTTPPVKTEAVSPTPSQPPPPVVPAHQPPPPSTVPVTPPAESPPATIQQDYSEPFQDTAVIPTEELPMESDF